MTSSEVEGVFWVIIIYLLSFIGIIITPIQIQDHLKVSNLPIGWCNTTCSSIEKDYVGYNTVSINNVEVFDKEINGTVLAEVTLKFPPPRKEFNTVKTKEADAWVSSVSNSITKCYYNSKTHEAWTQPAGIVVPIMLLIVCILIFVPTTAYIIWFAVDS